MEHNNRAKAISCSQLLTADQAAQMYESSGGKDWAIQLVLGVIHSMVKDGKLGTGHFVRDTFHFHQLVIL